jgi:plastocyanin
MRRTAALAATAALALAGCGGSDEPAATPAPTEAATTAAPTDTPAQQKTSSGASELKIAADPGGALAFTEKDLTAKAGKVTIQFANESQVPHAVEIEGQGVEEETKTVTGADAPPITVDLKPGTYTFYCPVDGHRAAGMEGKLVVR